MCSASKLLNPVSALPGSDNKFVNPGSLITNSSNKLLNPLAVITPKKSAPAQAAPGSLLTAPTSTASASLLGG